MHQKESMDSESMAAASEKAAEQVQQAPGHPLWVELERAQQLATQVSNWGGALFGLMRLELQLGLQSLPRMLALFLALLPLAGLTWISLSLLLAWFAYTASGVVAVGLAILFVLQLSLLLLCFWRLKRLRAKSTFPETRQQWHMFLAELHNGQQETASENSTKNRP